ncbi:MAG: DEAD/DEAH box helicase family protein, partial [Candidatus Scalindua sp.]|nr:DEAD/DEAH box helicase family protein [Candidatus Scalindua sp.]
NTFQTQHRFISASIQSLSRMTDVDKFHAVVKNMKYVIIDEAHHVSAPTYRVVLHKIKKLNPKIKILGVTATPFRGDECDIQEVLGDVIYAIDIKELILKGYLVPAQGVVESLPSALTAGIELRNNSSNDDYSNDSISKFFEDDKVQEYVLDKWVELFGDKKTMIFCPSLAVSKALNEKMHARGIRSSHIDAGTKERAKIVKSFKEGHIDVLTNMDIFTEGFDESSIEAIMMLRFTKSLLLYAQIVGRGLRPHPGKSHCSLLDFTINSQEHNDKLSDMASLYDVFNINSAVKRKERFFSVEAVDGKIEISNDLELDKSRLAEMQNSFTIGSQLINEIIELDKGEYVCGGEVSYSDEGVLMHNPLILLSRVLPNGLGAIDLINVETKAICKSYLDIPLSDLKYQMVLRWEMISDVKAVFPSRKNDVSIRNYFMLSHKDKDGANNAMDKLSTVGLNILYAHSLIKKDVDTLNFYKIVTQDGLYNGEMLSVEKLLMIEKREPNLKILNQNIKGMITFLNIKAEVKWISKKRNCFEMHVKYNKDTEDSDYIGNRNSIVLYRDLQASSYLKKILQYFIMINLVNNDTYFDLLKLFKIKKIKVEPDVREKLLSIAKRRQQLKDGVDEIWDINDTRDHMGRTLMHHAVMLNNEKMVKYLFEKSNVDLSIQDSIGWTATYYAVTGYNREVVSLFKGKIDCMSTIKDKTGRTLFDVAKEYSCESMLNILCGRS